MSWIGKIRRAGRIVEPAYDAPEATVAPPTGVPGSLQLRHVDCGSCNGCELEITSAFSSVYDAERWPRGRHTPARRCVRPAGSCRSSS